MFAILQALALFFGDLFKSSRRLEAENLILRHQLNLALRRTHPRIRIGDRLLLMLMTKLWSTLLGVVRVVQPETVLRWHRTGFACSGAESRAAWQGDHGLVAGCGC